MAIIRSLDSADLNEIKEAIEKYGIGKVTTNPSLLHKASTGDIGGYLREIIDTGLLVSIETIGKNKDELVSQARNLRKQFPQENIYVKIPVDPSFSREDETHLHALLAIEELHSEMNLNTTIVHSPSQYFLAAMAGSQVISPFLGRIDDFQRESKGLVAGKDFGKMDYFPAWNTGSGVFEFARILEITKQHNLKSKPLAASIRNGRQFKEIELLSEEKGVDIIITAPLAIYQELDQGLYTTEDGSKKSISEDEIKSGLAKIPPLNLNEISLKKTAENLIHLKTLAGAKTFFEDGSAITGYLALLDGKTATT